jgi:hypothetical protein
MQSSQFRTAVRRTVVLAASLAGLSGMASAQATTGTVEGKVTVGGTSEALPGASVSFAGTPRRRHHQG